jgi:hypothetical protein
MLTFVILGCIYFPADGLMTSTFGDYYDIKMMYHFISGIAM